MELKELLNKIKNKEPSKNLVFYSNENKLVSYEFIDVYENEGQIEIHIKEGEALEC